MTVLKVCTCVIGVYASMLPCDRISRASAVPSGSVQADTVPDFERCRQEHITLMSHDLSG